MIYRFPITTPANTTEENRLETRLPLMKGVIHKLEIYFPPGAQMLHHIRILDALHQCWPTNSDESFACDNFTIAFREHLYLKEEPYELIVYTWNDDDTHDHTLVIRLGILRLKYIAPWLLSWREKITSSE